MTISHVIYLEFARLIVSWQWVTEVCLESSTSDIQIQASKIVTELFCFPLAIDQAGAYIASGATTIGDYLAKYSGHRKTLLSHSEFTGASKYNKTVHETWELSYKEIQQRAKSDDS